MKRLLVVALVLAALGGCSASRARHEALPPGAQAPLAAGGMPVERVAFRLGESTVTVENMAKLQSCTGGAGAGLVTEPGPVEVYRMQCANGKVFMARCELRQCRQM